MAESFFVIYYSKSQVFVTYSYYTILPLITSCDTTVKCNIKINEYLSIKSIGINVKHGWTYWFCAVKGLLGLNDYMRFLELLKSIFHNQIEVEIAG